MKMDKGSGLVTHSPWVPPYSNEWMNNFKNCVVKLMIQSELSSTHDATITQRHYLSSALALTRILMPHTVVCRPFYAPITHFHPTHACMPFLLEVFYSLPLDTNNIHGHIFKHVSMHTTGSAMEWFCQLFQPIIKYPHHTCLTVLMTQNTFASSQWPLLLASQLDYYLILHALSMILSLPQTHWHDKQLYVAFFFRLTMAWSFYS